MRWRRRSAGDRKRLFFATDIHGSERCFRKWLNAAKALEADCLLLGGDITGKAVAPVVEGPNGWHATLNGRTLEARDEAELDELQTKVRARGLYAVLLSPDEAERLGTDDRFYESTFAGAMRETLGRWAELAGERLAGSDVVACFMLGNDDPPELAELLADSGVISYCENELRELPGDVEMISCGFSTPTPWHTPRELSEEDLGARIEELAARVTRPERAIFNFHCPPRDTHLDQAPSLDDQLRPRVGAGGLVMESVGSSSVRELIERTEPLLGLHGHVHESTGVQRLGGTVCINPGSDYQDGVLRSVVVDVTSEGIAQWQLLQA